MGSAEPPMWSAEATVGSAEPRMWSAGPWSRVSRPWRRRRRPWRRIWTQSRPCKFRRDPADWVGKCTTVFATKIGAGKTDTRPNSSPERPIREYVRVSLRIHLGLTLSRSAPSFSGAQLADEQRRPLRSGTPNVDMNDPIIDMLGRDLQYRPWANATYMAADKTESLRRGGHNVGRVKRQTRPEGGRRSRAVPRGGRRADRAAAPRPSAMRLCCHEALNAMAWDAMACV